MGIIKGNLNNLWMIRVEKSLLALKKCVPAGDRTGVEDVICVYSLSYKLLEVGI